MNYNNKIFKSISTSKNGVVTSDTVFRYKQIDNILTSEYSGGNIKFGHLIGVVDTDGSIEMRYHQVNLNGDLMTGKCKSIPELLPNGKIRLHETWQWTSGDKTEGSSIIEEQ
jgi:hypothetical protein